jgi:hypothetical protein
VDADDHDFIAWKRAYRCGENAKNCLLQTNWACMVVFSSNERNMLPIRSFLDMYPLQLYCHYKFSRNEILKQDTLTRVQETMLTAHKYQTKQKYRKIYTRRRKKAQHQTMQIRKFKLRLSRKI